MTIPIPVLDDRSFDQLVEEARARVAVHTPEYSNLGLADPGATIIDAFAFLTENLLYRSNRIPEANRLKFLTMLGISLQPPSAGRGLVQFTNDKGPLEPLALRAGSEVRAGQVPFATTTPLAVLPVTTAAYYKHPQPALDDATTRRYQLIYQTFLDSETDQLTFYDPVALDPPTPGKPDPVVDLGDPVNGTIDRSLWLAVLAPKNTDLDAVRAAIGGQSLSIGIYPAAGVAGFALPPRSTTLGSTGPGLTVEIAAPEPDPSGLAGPGFGIGAPRYAPLPRTYAEPVLDAPGVLHVTLPPYERILLWAFDPEEDGTGDYPPRVDDADVSSRLVTWLRLRYPASATSPASGASVDGTSQDGDDTRDAGDRGDGSADAGGGCGCGCGGDLATTTTLSASTEGRGRLTWAGVNVAQVVQSVAVRDELLGQGTGTPFQTFTLAHTPVLLDDDGRGVVLEVQDVDGTWVGWHVVDDIYATSPDEPAYVLDPATGRVTGGSGLRGRRWPLRAAVRASYSYGGGPQGQQAVGAITKSVALPGGFTVVNPVATWAAGPGERVADGEAAVTRWLRHRDRLVTIDDFRDLTRRAPGVDLGRVEVLPLFHPESADSAQAWPGVVTVLVIPRSDAAHPKAPVPDRQFLRAVCAWLDPRRLVTTELHVRGPVYRRVWVSVGVEVQAGQVPTIVEQAVTAAVQGFLSPLTGGLPVTGDDSGLVGPAVVATGIGWPLSTDVRAQDVEAVATRVPGVRYVHSVQMAVESVGGAVVSPVTTVPLTGLELPEATVFATSGPATDPADLVGAAQPVPGTQVAVPVVPPTC